MCVYVYIYIYIYISAGAAKLSGDVEQRWAATVPESDLS